MKQRTRPRRANKRRIPIYARDGKQCFYCGIPTVEHNDPSGIQKNDQATLDHFYSQEQVDNATWRNPRNYVIACYACNQEKAERDPIEFCISKYLYLKYTVLHKLRMKYDRTDITRRRRRNNSSDSLPKPD